MALHVINLSLDVPNRYEFTYIEEEQGGLAESDLESCGELFLRHLLDFANSGSLPTDSEEIPDPAPIGPDYFVHHPFAYALAPFSTHLETQLMPFRPASPPTPVAEILAPPPQYAA